MRNLRNLIQAGLVIFATLGLSAPLALATEDSTLEVNRSGQDLFEDCNGPETNRLLCHGYVIGIADALLLEKSAGSNFAGWDACIPTEAKSAQLLAVVNKMLVERPELRHRPAASIVATALSEAFPCNP